MDNILKYLSMKSLIGLPNFQINPATRKNLADRLIAEAITNRGRLILKAPAEIVKILYGINVNPAVKIIINPYSEYLFCMDVKISSVNPGILLKKKCAIAEYVTPSHHK